MMKMVSAGELARLQAIEVTARALNTIIGDDSIRCPECGKHTDNLVAVFRHAHGPCRETLTSSPIGDAIRALRRELGEP